MNEIEGYTDLEIVGRGGFAIVYKATQVSIGRQVAIKLLSDPSPDDDLVRRFRRESKAVGALSWHPHIAAVVDAGTTSLGQAYIVFELLGGGSLEEKIEQQPMPWHDAVEAMIQIADAVEAAHRADVLHRDIKPANILLNRIGVAKLGDFGIASMQDGNKTETGMLATTVAHAAPELFNGAHASEATDVYALGSTLHTLLDGTAPFAPAPEERIVTTITRIINEPPPAIHAQVPAQIQAVVTHALAKQPQYRLRAAASFGQALQQAQRDLGVRVTAMPVTDAEPTRPVKPAAVDSAARETLKTDQSQTSGEFAVPDTAISGEFAMPVADTSGEFAMPAADTSGEFTVPAGTSGEFNVPPGTSGEFYPPNAGTSGEFTVPAGTSGEFYPPTAQPAPATQHLAINPALKPAAVSGPKPFSRTIVALSIVAVALAGLLAWLAFFDSGRASMATTDGGAELFSQSATRATRMGPPFESANAVDQDDSTYWGVTTGVDGREVRGTAYHIRFTGEQKITSVGIDNGDSTELGRASGVIWATSFDEAAIDGTEQVIQDLDDVAGQQTIPFEFTSDQLVVVISGVHGEVDQIGIAEILIEVE